MITVLIATCNGASTLPTTLDSYGRLNGGDYAWNMLVVDNASTDATPAILESYAQRLPLRSIRTEKRGKNVKPASMAPVPFSNERREVLNLG